MAEHARRSSDTSTSRKTSSSQWIVQILGTAKRSYMEAGCHSIVGGESHSLGSSRQLYLAQSLSGWWNVGKTADWLNS